MLISFQRSMVLLSASEQMPMMPMMLMLLLLMVDAQFLYKNEWLV